MANETKTIVVADGTDVARLLDEAAIGPLVLEKNGKRYLLAPATNLDDIWAGYDPDAALAGIRRATGRWNDIDAEEFKEYIYRAREEGTRPIDRPFKSSSRASSSST